RLAKTDATKSRLLNLRIYESHNERANQKKIEMFSTGELAIFRRVGLTPVFFAESIIGAARPNLTYMLVFPDDAGRNAAWGRFRGGRRMAETAVHTRVLGQGDRLADHESDTDA